jgi:hypothetical protein
MFRVMIGWTLLAATMAAAQVPDAAQALAARYGVESWSQVEELRYTFNVVSSRGETHRGWIWRPREGTVTRQVSGEGDVTFHESDSTRLEDDPMQRPDRQFINDQYWLLFPFHLVWDSTVTVTDDGPQAAPLELGTMPRITAQYHSEGGYTPGDAYELSVDEAGLVRAWNFRSGGGSEGRPMLWTELRRLGPLTITTEFSNPDSGTRLWFSDVSAVISGEEVALEPLSN